MASIEKVISRVEKEQKFQAIYLGDLHLKPYLVPPDNDAIFRAAAHIRHRGEQGHLTLREDTVDYMKSNVKKFVHFLGDEGDSLTSAQNEVLEEMDELSRPGISVGYETLMGLTRVLRAAILITSGGTSDRDPVQTNAYYFGREFPSETVHLGYLSTYSIYYAVVHTGSRDSNFDLADWLYDNWTQSKSDNPLTGRKPSHFCYCRGACSCRALYEKPWSFTPMPKESSKAKKLKPKERRSSPELLIRKDFLQDVFLWVSAQGAVTRDWKFVLLKYGLSSDDVTGLEMSYRPIRERILHGLEQGEQKGGSMGRGGEMMRVCSVLARLEKALRSNGLNLVADNMQEEFGGPIRWW